MEAISDYLKLLTDRPLVLFLVFFCFSLANFYFPPIPLESLTLFGGYLAGTGRGSLLMIIWAASSGMFAGSAILFLAARRFADFIFTRVPFSKIPPQVYHKAAGWFDKYGLYSIFLGKIIPGMSLATVIFCGKMNWKTSKVLLAIFASNLLFYAALGITGRIIGANWRKALVWLKHLNLMGLGILGFIIIAVTIYFLYRYRKLR